MTSESKPTSSQPLWSCAIGRLRIVSFLEALSYLLLLGVAMPLKYIWNFPEAVAVVGMIHGILFVLLCFVLLFAMLHAKWSIIQAGGVFIAALLPFVPFWVDRWLKKEQDRCEG